MATPKLDVPFMKVLVDIYTHPKTFAAIEMLGCDANQFVGSLVGLWTWAVALKPDGDLRRYTDRQLAEVSHWTGDASAFVQALMECGGEDGDGFLNRDRTIHNWKLYASPHVMARAEEADRKRSERAQNRVSNGVQGCPEVSGDVRESTPRTRTRTRTRTREESSSLTNTSAMAAAAACPAPAANSNGHGLNAVACDHAIATYTAQGHTRSAVEEALVVVASRIAEGKIIRNLTAYVGTILQQPVQAPAPPEPEVRDTSQLAPAELIAERRAQRLAREREVFGE